MYIILAGNSNVRVCILHSRSCTGNKGTCVFDNIFSSKYHYSCSHKLFCCLWGSVFGKVSFSLILIFNHYSKTKPSFMFLYSCLIPIYKNQNCEFTLFEASLCRIVGALVIIMGLYLVLWGKTKDHAIENKAARPIDDATPIAWFWTLNNSVLAT